MCSTSEPGRISASFVRTQVSAYQTGSKRSFRWSDGRLRRQYRQLLESNDSIPAERYDRLRVGVAQITRELYAKFLRLIAADERIKGACAGNATILRQALKTFDNRLNAELTRVIDACRT